MALNIADTAHVDPRAEIADEVAIGPFCVIGPHVRIGRGTILYNNVTLMGHTEIGEDNTLFPNCVIGAEPQDVSYRGSPTRVEIGDRNTIREGVTIHRATEKEDGITRIGSDCYLMALVHVAHDCKLGNRVHIANATMLGGHVHVRDLATLSGSVALHHFTSVGAYSFVGGHSRIVHDVPPFMLVDGNPSRVRCVNMVGLKRNGFSDEEIAGLSEAHRLIYRAKMGLRHATEILTHHGHVSGPVRELLAAVEAQYEGKHGRAREKTRGVRLEA